MPEEKKTEVHGTQEWSSYSVNIQTGCSNDCKYCYAKNIAMRFGTKTPDNWCEPDMRKHDIVRTFRKREGRAMFPSTHDITPENIDDYCYVLRSLLLAENSVLIVSKPSLECIKRICKEFADARRKILFRFSIGSTDSATLKYWEPNAPSFEARLEALKYAFGQGFQTSVSTEPMLDTNVDELIEAVRPYVADSIWLGKMNRINQILSLNCPGDLEARQRAAKLMAQQNDDWIRELYRKYQNNPMIKWKDSLKKVLGIERPTEAGLDV